MSAPPNAMSTAISDAVLSFAAYKSFLNLQSRYPASAYGVLLLAAAAGVGAVRFASIGGSPVRNLHAFLSQWSFTVTFAMVGVAYMNLPYAFELLAGMSAVFLLSEVLKIDSDKQEMAGQVFGGAGIAGTIYAGLQMFLRGDPRGQFALIGIGLAVAAVVLGTDGRISGFRRVDVFHYMLAAGIYLVAMGL